MGRIAIVDDSRLARTFAASCLKELAHTVEVVEPTSLFDVLARLKELDPDLLIMDFLMPSCPGTSLVKVCREETGLKDMKTLVLTAHHDEEAMARLRTMGVVDVLFKPVDAGALAAKVAELLG